MRPLSRTFRELAAISWNHELWVALAVSDTRVRYRRTKLGPLWITLSTGITVLGVGTVYGNIFVGPSDLNGVSYLAYLACGLVLWSFVSQTITDGCLTFIQASGLIKSLPLPLLLHAYRMLAKNIILLAHNAIIIVLLWLFMQWPLSWTVLLIIPGLILNFIALFGISLSLGVLCARFRDIQPMVAALLQLAFLLTPIIWTPHAVRSNAAGWLLDINPFYYLIEVVRAPLLGQPIEVWIWVMALVVATALFLGSALLYGRFSLRIPYWL